MSLMPPGLPGALSEQEVKDLVSFLLTKPQRDGSKERDFPRRVASPRAKLVPIDLSLPHPTARHAPLKVALLHFS